MGLFADAWYVLFDSDMESETSGLFIAIRVLLMIAGLRSVFNFCWARIFPAKPAAAAAQAGEQDEAAGGVPAEKSEEENDAFMAAMDPKELLEPKRSVAACYVLWALGGVLGIHHFYLGRTAHGILAMWSFNFLGLGFLADMVMIPFYVRSNNMQCHCQAPLDDARWDLCVRLPGTIGGLVALVVGSLLYFPLLLQFTGAVDIDRMAAQTAANPYETLGLSRVASLAEAKAAYRKESLRWHPDRNLNCGKECDEKMHEITKAFELIKRRRAPAPRDRTFQGIFLEAAKDWQALVEAITS